MKGECPPNEQGMKGERDLNEMGTVIVNDRIIPCLLSSIACLSAWPAVRQDYPGHTRPCRMAAVLTGCIW